MARIIKNLVYLDPIPHVYIHRVTGEKFTSVTKVLSSVENEFEGDVIAERIAKLGKRYYNEVYHGMNKAQILEYWDLLNTEATESGTEIHEIIERYLLAEKWYTPKNDLEKLVIDEYDRLKFDEGIEIYPERVLFSEEHKLAGTADLIIDVNNEYFDVGDWKTNQVIRFYDEFGNKTLLPPVSHLQDCEYSIYTLQLSIYALMYEMETGKQCRHIWIGHYDKKINKMTKVPIMYLKYEARQLLNHFKYQNQLKY